MSKIKLVWIFILFSFLLVLFSSNISASEISYTGTNRMVISTVPNSLIPGYSVCDLSGMSCYAVLLFPIDEKNMHFNNLFLDINHDIESGNPESLELCVVDSSKISKTTFSQVNSKMDCSNSQIIIINDGSSSIELNDYNKNYNTFVLKPRQKEISLKITGSRLHGNKKEQVLNCINTGNVCCDECSDGATISNSGCLGSNVCCSTCKVKSNSTTNPILNTTTIFNNSNSIDIISGSSKVFTTCKINSLSTDKLNYNLGELVTINLETSNCNNSLIDINIYDKDLLSSNIILTKHLITSNNMTSFTWIPSDKYDLSSVSEFYLVASSNNTLDSSIFSIDYSKFNKDSILNDSFSNSLKKIESISFSNSKIALDLCSSYNNYKHDDCFKDLAKANNDPNYCSYIDSDLSKDQCYLFFINLGSTYLCSELVSNNLLCYSMTSAQSNTNVYKLTNAQYLNSQKKRHPDLAISSLSHNSKLLFTWKHSFLISIMLIVFGIYIYIVVSADRLKKRHQNKNKL